MLDIAESRTIERFGDRVTLIAQTFRQDPEILSALDTTADVYRAICELRLREDRVTKVSRPNVVSFKQWTRYCDGTTPVPHEYLAAIIRLFPEVTWDMLTAPTLAAFVSATGEVAQAHARWKAAADLMRERRAELAVIAMRYYRETPKVPGLPLLAQAQWLPARPIRLREDTAMRFEEGIPPGAPEALEGLRIDYAECKARHSPRRSTNGESFRLVAADLSRGGADLSFQATDYFSYINDLEAIGVELADWVLRHGGIEACLADERLVPAAGDLKRRGAPGKAFDIADRHSFAGVNCLLMARNLRVHKGDKPTDFFFYHDRTDKTLEAQFTTHVVPAGGHQPYTMGFGRPEEANVYRTVVKEFCEELYNKEEAAAVRAHGGVFLEHPDVATQVQAFFRSGAAGVSLLGLGLDPLTLKPELLVAVVVDWEIARRHAGNRDLAITHNYEGDVKPRGLSRGELEQILATPPLGKGPDGVLRPKPWLPAGAACVQLAIQSYDALMPGAA